MSDKDLLSGGAEAAGAARPLEADIFMAGESYWTPPRLELLEGFKRKASHLGSLYAASVTLFSTPSFPARQYLVAHAVREIGNRLPDAVGVQIENTRVEHVNRLDDIAKMWERDGLPGDYAIPIVAPQAQAEAPSGIWLPRRTAEAFVHLVRDHAHSREQRRAAPIRLLQELARDSGMTIDQLRPIALQWDAVLKWFVKKVHVGKEERVVLDEEFNHHFELFERYLGSMLRPFFSALKEVDDFLNEANN